MFTNLLVTLAMIPSAPGPKEKEKPAAKLAEIIVGEWEAVSGIRNGKEAKLDPGQVTITFSSDGRVKTHEGKGREKEGTYKLDAAKSPAHLDLSVENEATRVVQGIVKIDGDTMTFCFVKPGDGDRPKKFEAAGAEVMLLVLKRVKPTEKK